MAGPLDDLLKKVKEKKYSLEGTEEESAKESGETQKEEKTEPQKIPQIKPNLSKEQAKDELKRVLTESRTAEQKKTEFSQIKIPPKKIIEDAKAAKIQEMEAKRNEMKSRAAREEDIPPEKTDLEKELESEEKTLIESYGKTKIFKLKKSGLNYYFTPVPRPTGPEKAIINTLKEAATRIISIAPYKIRDQEQRRKVYYDKIMEMLKSSPELRIPESKYDFYVDAVVREMVGYGMIDELIKDDGLEEIMIIGAQKPVYVFHRKYEMMLTNIEFYSNKDVEDLINRIARQIGRRVDISSPLLDARLPDGSRVNATIEPASVSGASLTIRKFKEEPYSIIDLIEMGTVSSELAAYLWLMVEGMNSKPANILIAGGTGSGKTTTLNVLASFIPETERIISIEDTAELSLPMQHWIRMEARPPGIEGTGELTMDILTKNALRMRPDRIIVGEIRHNEAFTLFTAMNTGHEGSMGTVHANTAAETIVRVTNPPMDVPEVMMAGLNFILVQNRIHDRKKGTIRRVTELAELSGSLEGKAKTVTVFEWDPGKDEITRTEQGMNYLKELERFTGSSRKQIEDEIRQRKEFLEALQKKKIKIMQLVSEKCSEFLNSKRD